MLIKTQRTIGKNTWVFERELNSPDYQKIFFKMASFIDALPTVCGNCKKDNLRLMHRRPQGYDYYIIKCDDCRWELEFGQHQEQPTLFAKKWEQEYQADGQGGGNGGQRNNSNQNQNQNWSQQQTPPGQQGATESGNFEKNPDIPF